MSFKTPVAANKPFAYSPTEAELFVTPTRKATAAEQANGLPEDVFDVQINLTAISETSAVVTDQSVHTFPASIKEGVISYDVHKMQPVVNWQGVASLFAQFGLSIPAEDTTAQQ